MFKNKLSLNIGLPTMLLVFIVMCLFSLSVLSLVGASSNWNLTSKALERNNTYFETCNNAEDELKNINEQAWKLYHSQSKSSYLKEVATLPNTFVFPMTELQNLSIEIKYQVPDANGFCYEILAWKIVPVEDIIYNQKLNVIQ